MGMKPVMIALDGDTASYLALALKEELAENRHSSTTARVYHDVIAAIVAAFDPPGPSLYLVEADETKMPDDHRKRRSQSSF